MRCMCSMETWMRARWAFLRHGLVQQPVCYVSLDSRHYLLCHNKVFKLDHFSESR